MNKFLPIFLCSVVLNFVLQAQSITISEGVNVRNDAGYEILGRYKGNLLLFRDKNNEYEVTAFDEQLHNIWTHEITFAEKKVQVLDAVQGSDYFAVIYKGREKNNSIVKINRFDANTNFIDSSLIKNYGSRFYAPTPISVFSENKKILLVYSFSQNGSIEASSFDIENMKLIWQKEIVLPGNIRTNDEFRQVIVDNKGKSYFIFEENETAAIFGSTEHQYIVCEANQLEHNSYKIPFKGYTTYGIHFDFDNANQQLSAVGLCSEKGKSRATGCFFLRVKNKEQRITFEVFSDNLASVIAGKEIVNNKGIADLKPQNIVFRKDGGVVAFFEETRQYSRTSAGIAARGITSGTETTGRFVMDYYCDNVIVVSFNPDGTVQWKKVLPKKQFSQDDDAIFSSFGLLKTPRAVRVLFNDGINAETTTSEYIMNGNGLIERHSMFNTANQDILLRFQDVMQLSSDEVVIPSEYRSKLRLVRLRY
jgi:hypothetical protein